MIQTLELYILILMLLWLGFACDQEKKPAKLPLKASEQLKAHNAQFKKEIIQVTDGVYVAVGYGLANSILLEGSDGVLIVDTMESAEAARPVKEAFSRITTKPVKAIIYTHYHSDHTFGAKVMAGDDQPDIISHETTLYYLDRIANITRDLTYLRAMRQFGVFLPRGWLINAGIGPSLKYDKNKSIALLFPTHTFSGDHLSLNMAGLKLELYHAPGETNDQIFVWLPEKRVLLPADNFYHSFPNLYAIRGTAYRDVMKWVASIDKMRRLNAKYLVPGHTRPIKGAAKIQEILTNYRDAIQFVHDQTIRLMNKGLTPREIAGQIHLPPHLARLPYLKEFYGTVQWSVRAVFDGYMGWFGGNPTDLFPLARDIEGKKVASLVGGKDRLLEQAKSAYEQRDFQWVLRLTDWLLCLEPDLVQARSLRANALKALAEQQISAPARNYYLTQSLEIQGDLKIRKSEQKALDIVHQIPLESIFRSMAVRLVPEKSQDVDMAVAFRFPDTGQAYTVHVRKGVADIQPVLLKDADVKVTINSLAWKELAAGIRSPAISLFKDIKKDGSLLKLMKFFSLFED